MPTLSELLRSGTLNERRPLIAPGSLAELLSKPLDMEGRAAFLPYQQTPQGNQWALPRLLAAPLNAATSFGRAWQGQPVGEDEGMNVALSMLFGGVPGGARGPGSVGMTSGKPPSNVSNSLMQKLEAADATEHSQLMKELSSMRQSEAIGELQKHADWVKEVTPLYQKARTLWDAGVVPVAGERYDPQWALSNADRFLETLNGIGKSNDPVMTAHKLQGSRTNEITQNLKGYLEQVAEYRKTLTKRSKYDRVHIDIIDSVLGNVKPIE